jgi:hypothetical protein
MRPRCHLHSTPRDPTATSVLSSINTFWFSTGEGEVATTKAYKGLKHETWVHVRLIILPGTSSCPTKPANGTNKRNKRKENNGDHF